MAVSSGMQLSFCALLTGLLAVAGVDLGLTPSVIERAVWSPPLSSSLVTPITSLGCAATISLRRPLRVLAIGGSNTRGAGDLSEEDVAQYSYWGLFGKTLEPHAKTTVASPRGGLCQYMRTVTSASLRGYDLVFLEG